MEKLRPIAEKIVQELLSDNDVKHQEEVTSHIAQDLEALVQKGVVERRDIMKEKRENSLNKLVQSMINDMWPIVTSTIKESIDTSNINKANYDRTVRRLLPQLVQTVEDTHLRKVLSYPVVEDELKIIIRSNNLTYSEHDLADMIFGRLVSKLLFLQSEFSG